MNDSFSNHTQIIVQIKKGNKKALEAVYLELHDPFINWMWQKYQCNKVDALSIYHDSMEAFYKNILNNKLTELRSSIKTYVFAIAKNLWLQQQRKAIHVKNHKESLTAKNSNTSQVPSTDNELTQVVEQTINSMQEPCASILRLSLVYHLTPNEMMDKLSYKSKDVLYTQKNRCLKRLQTFIRQNFSKEDFI